MGNRPDDETIRRFNREHRAERSTDQLIGFCQGILADGIISTEEATTLQAWIENNWDLRDTWPINILYTRLDQILADGEISLDEQKDLIEIMLDLSGGPLPTREDARSTITTLPLTRPMPDVIIEGKAFVVTGTFEYGKRSEVIADIKDRDGIVNASVSKYTDYLVIGSLGSADWLHASFGRKILDAIEKQKAGCRVAIVAEEHWARFM